MNKLFARRLIMMVAGIVLIGFGVALFKLSVTGNDPSSAMVMAVSDCIKVDFAILLIIFNTVYFIFEFLFARSRIGIGTVVNWFGVGYVVSFFYGLLNGFVPAEPIWPVRLLLLLAGVLVLSAGASLYQTADMGIGPYDVLSIIISEKTHFRYFGCRMFTDLACAVTTAALGGLIGIGTLMAAVGMGPFISWFDHHLSRPLLGH